MLDQVATASAGDVDLVIQYARHAVGEPAWSRTVMDPMIAPLGVGLLRDNRIVRSAVWQAFDARHLR